MQRAQKTLNPTVDLENPSLQKATGPIRCQNYSPCHGAHKRITIIIIIAIVITIIFMITVRSTIVIAVVVISSITIAMRLMTT